MKFPGAKAMSIGDELCHNWIDCCERIEIGGSIRRREPDVKDIEIVAQPIYCTDLFGEPTVEDKLIPAVAAMMGRDELVWRRLKGGAVLDKSPGEQAAALEQNVRAPRRYVPMVHKRSGIPVDLFIVRPPSNYFWQLIIRTGSAAFSKHMVIQAKWRGFDCRDGAVWTRDEKPEAIDFESEEAVFVHLGLSYVEPRKR